MNILGESLLGWSIVVLLCIQGITIIKTSIGGLRLFYHPYRPEGSFLSLPRLTDTLSVLIRRLFIPLCAILLIMNRFAVVDRTRIAIDIDWFVLSIESLGILLYLAGHGIILWDHIASWNYHMSDPLPNPDEQYTHIGSAVYIRYPRYTEVLLLVFGLGFLLQSCFVLFLGISFLVMVLLLIPFRESQYEMWHGDNFLVYQRKSKRLIPFLY